MLLILNQINTQRLHSHGTEYKIYDYIDKSGFLGSKQALQDEALRNVNVPSLVSKPKLYQNHIPK